MSLSKPTGWGAVSVVGAGGRSSTRVIPGGGRLTMSFFPRTAGGGEPEGGVCADRTPPAQRRPVTRRTRGRRRMAAPYELRLVVLSALNYSLLARVSTDADAAGRTLAARLRAILA